jgi:hypothetical protein
MSQIPTFQPDMTDIFHRSKALLVEVRKTICKRGLKGKLREVEQNLEYMYGQLALLEDQGRTGVDQNDDLHDSMEEGEDLW